MSELARAMPNNNLSPTAFVKEFCARTRRLREASGKDQNQMALALGRSPEAYRKNEKRSPLPHYLIPRFAAIVGCSIEFLMTGRETTLPRRSRAQKGGGSVSGTGGSLS